MKAVTGSLMGLVVCVSAAAEPLLEGRVRLDSGAPVPGVQVLLFDLEDVRAAPVAASTDGSGLFILPLAALTGVLPEQFELGANYPNPFNPSTMVPYQLPTEMFVRLEVFNLLGQRVATLVDGGQPAGRHTATWDATDGAGQAVGAGVYLYRLSGDGVQATRSMLLIDGQAGIASGGGGSTGLEGETGAGEDMEPAPAYGLTVSGPGLVPYVDPAFRVQAGMAPLDLVVPGRPPRAKAASSGGILGDVDNTGGVDFFDALLVALYSRDSSIVMPNHGDISLGDVNADGQVDLADAWLIAAWLSDPSDPTLPGGIGEPVGPAALLSPDPSTVTFAADGVWHRFTVQAAEPVAVVVNPEGTIPRLEITTRSGRSNFCPAETDDDVSREDGQAVYLAGCGTGPATVELRRPSDGTVLRTYTFEVIGSPDLVVESASVSDSALTPGQSFTLRATVRNQGTGPSAGTTLRWYRSSNRTMSTQDTQVGTDPVIALGASRTSAESISLTAPSNVGTYYYGACVVSVSGETNTRNNCSTGIRVTVEARSPDLVVESVSVSDSTLTPGHSFTLTATVRNQGTGRSVATTLRWYRSSNRTISTRDTQVGTDPVGALAASRTSAESISLPAPSSEGTYYYGACVATVTAESETGNNCSPAVTVTVEAATALKLYWTDLQAARIQRSNLDGSQVEDLVTTGLVDPSGIALDGPGGKIYWTDAGTDKIQRSNLDGSRVEDLVTTGLTAPSAIALDLAGGKMYWTDVAGTIQRSNHDGSGVEDLVTRLDGPLALALDVHGGRMYWTAGKIQRSNLDGSGVEDLVTRVSGPVGIALDVGRGKVYWTDTDADRIQRANLDGTEVEDLVTGVPAPVGITVDEQRGRMYWTDIATDNIRRSNLDGSGVEDLVTTGLTAPWHLALGPAGIGAQTRPLRFHDGESTTRSVQENLPAGINVGGPVSVVGATGLSTLTYDIRGPDALSFDIVPTTGQIRTRQGVTYDYEDKKRYAVLVGVGDGEGHRETIEVTIHVIDLAPFCGSPGALNLRTYHGNRLLTLKWDPLPDVQGHAPVLGYQTEIRRGTSGPWTARRAFLGPNIAGTVYANLHNAIGYEVRVRPINEEGDCGWSAPVRGTPSAAFAPRNSMQHFDRFGPVPVGSPDGNFRFLTPERCRHTSLGQTLDADCQYRSTGPNTGRISLDFDDPSRGSCEITLAYSSLTEGSFIDGCFDAGVNTNVSFDRSFRMPRARPQSGSDLNPPPTETDVPRAPRTPQEFDSLVSGRDDFIPGLVFNRLCVYCDRSLDAGPAWASRIEFDSNGLREFPGRYSYRNIGPSQGVLTFEGNDGGVYVFNLQFERSGHVRTTTTDLAGNRVVWPGLQHLDPRLGDQPILLVTPPFWSEAIAIETDFAPEDWDDWYADRWGRHSLPQEWEQALFADLYEPLFGGESDGLTYLNRATYRKIGRNRSEMTVEFSGSGFGDDHQYEGLDEFQRSMLGSTWTFELAFTSDGGAKFTLTITKEGYLPTVIEGFRDFSGDRIDSDELPDELLLPDDPPQAAGEDVSGVEVAAAVTTPAIGADDVQTFLVSSAGAAYQPGDWLEPKDGSNQRMMVAGTGPPGAAKPVGPSTSASALLQRRAPKTQSTVFPHTFSAFSWTLVPRWKRTGQAGYSASGSTITQLSVVCMQIDRDIPTRGARYFSQPKMAQDPVQLCQQECVLTETDNLQSCVWNCESDHQSTDGPPQFSSGDHQ